MLRGTAKTFLVTIVVLAGSALSACSSNTAPVYYAYETGLPYEKTGYVISPKGTAYYVPSPWENAEAQDGSITWGGDFVRHYKDCAEDEQYTCLFSTNVVFVLPKRMSKEMGGWSCRDYEFVVRENNVSVKLFGKKFDNLYRIEIPPAFTPRGREDGDMFEFLYNPQVGVIAFGYVPPLEAERAGYTY